MTLPSRPPSAGRSSEASQLWAQYATVVLEMADTYLRDHPDAELLKKQVGTYRASTSQQDTDAATEADQEMLQPDQMFSWNPFKWY